MAPPSEGRRLLIVTGLFPSPTSPVRGLFVADQVALLRRAGHDVRVVNVLPHMPAWYARRRATFAGVAETPRTYEHDEVPVRVIRFRSWPRHPFPGRTLAGLARQVGAVEAWLDGWRPELIHCHTLFPAAGLAEPLASAWQVPLLGTVHGWDYDVARLGRLAPYEARLTAGLSALVVVNEDHVGIGHELGAPRVECIPCHAEVAGERVGTWSGSARAAGEKRARLLFPAHPDRAEKDHGLFLAAINDLESRGWAVEHDALGGVARTDVWRRMADADAVVLTSLREGSPLVPKEARRIGAPVASVPVGDVADYLPETVIATERTGAAVAEAVLAALDGDVDWPDLPATALPEGVLGRLEALYGDLLA